MCAVKLIWYRSHSVHKLIQCVFNYYTECTRFNFDNVRALSGVLHVHLSLCHSTEVMRLNMWLVVTWNYGVYCISASDLLCNVLLGLCNKLASINSCAFLVVSQHKPLLLFSAQITITPLQWYVHTHTMKWSHKNSEYLLLPILLNLRGKHAIACSGKPSPSKRQSHLGA